MEGSAVAEGFLRVSCALCDRSEQVMKRCMRCMEVYYCSRSCQVKNWPSHKAECMLKTSKCASKSNMNKENNATVSKKPVSSDSHLVKMKNTEETKPENSTIIQSLTSGTKLTTSSVETSNGQFSEKRNSSCRDGGSNKNTYEVHDYINTILDATDGSSSKNLAEYKTIFVKHNHKKLELQVTNPDAYQQISDLVHIPVTKLKLIHKGKVVNSDSIDKFLAEKALFLAIGEVAESEEGLDKKDIDLIIEQLRVNRNTAIKALRQHGNVVDAILEIGNST